MTEMCECGHEKDLHLFNGKGACITSRCSCTEFKSVEKEKAIRRVIPFTIMPY